MRNETEKTHMRKTIALCLLLLAALPALAQAPRVRTEWGALAGVHVPNYTTSDNFASIKNRVGWQAGISMAVRFNSFFAVEPQILYLRDGLRFNFEGEQLKLRSNSIDVPVLVSFRLLNLLRLYAGPVFTVMNDCKLSTGDPSPYDFGRLRPTLSYTIGAGVKFTRHLLIDLRYNGQFKSKREIVLPDGGDLDKLRSYNVALSLGYLF